MNRRGFLGSILALGAAPAIVRADSLMRIVPMETEILPAGTLGKLDGVQFYESDLALSLDEFSQRYVEPAMASLVAGIESDMLAALTQTIYEPRTIKIRMPNSYTVRRDARFIA